MTPQKGHPSQTGISPKREIPSKQASSSYHDIQPFLAHFRGEVFVETLSTAMRALVDFEEDVNFAQILGEV